MGCGFPTTPGWRRREIPRLHPRNQLGWTKSHPEVTTGACRSPAGFLLSTRGCSPQAAPGNAEAASSHQLPQRPRAPGAAQSFTWWRLLWEALLPFPPQLLAENTPWETTIDLVCRKYPSSGIRFAQPEWLWGACEVLEAVGSSPSLMLFAEGCSR